MNDKTKHTPGPWVNRHGMLYGSNGAFVVAAAVGLGLGSDSGDGVRRANGHLVAAAPELLEALRGLMHLDEELCSEGAIEALDKARSAIARATGATP